VLWFAVDLLKDLGHVAIEAKTAAEALALLDDGTPRIDAMVTDLGLPDLRGDALVLEARTIVVVEDELMVLWFAVDLLKVSVG